MPRYRIHNNKRRLCCISRRRTLQSAVQEWIAQEIRGTYPKSTIYLEDTWENEIPENSGGGCIRIDEVSLPFEWEITEEPMELTIAQLSKPIEIFVVMLDFYSEVDGQMLGSSPITATFSEKFARDMCGKNTSREKWRVEKVCTTGAFGLQRMLDKLTDGE